MRSLLALPVLLALSPALFAQSGTADQSSPFGNAWFNGGSPGLTWQAEVACGLAGELEGFELYLQGAAGATLDVSVKVGSGWNVGAAVWSGTLTTNGTGGWEHFFVDTSSSSIALNVGDLFVIEMAGITGVGIQGQYNAPPATPPYPEELYLNTPGCFADCGWRIGFVTWMEQGGPALSKSGSCPGPMSLTVTDATPRGPVAILHGLPGSYTRGGGSCAGLTIGISQPTLAGIIRANANGIAAINFNAPPALCGRSVIGIDLRSCTATNVITL